MMPDFSKPAFAFVALCNVRFRSSEEGGRSGPFRSDYRCQVRYVDEKAEHLDEARVYFVGQEQVHAAAEEVAVVLAFLDWERQRDRCRVGTRFELREGGVVTATGAVHVIAAR
jgi:translation elongation factor EF-Tu-like GTPase